MSDETGLSTHYNNTRKQTLRLAEGLSAEDLIAQSMPDASPGKWHLAHTTWFFETFILQKFDPNFRWFNEHYCYLFNSYYDSVGSRHARPQRGLLTRPALDEVYAYREHVDERMRIVLAERMEDIAPLVTIGLHHEMQHQELFLTDLLHLLSHNPLYPEIISRPQNNTPKSNNVSSSSKVALPKMLAFEPGVVSVGAQTQGSDTWSNFSYDCEQPEHGTLLHPFKLATSLITNAQWMAFMDDGGYNDPLLWLSDGWAYKNKAQWEAPLYWQKREEDSPWCQYGLDGLHEVDPNAPVSHISLYEADAFARWCGKRLPREHEWEWIASSKPIEGNFLERHQWRPGAIQTVGGQTTASNIPRKNFDDIYGDVWEWTQSAFSPYPGFEAKQGALGEYNGKFMASQFVLKGGSCATPRMQLRASYRNFFYPHQRWQFTGVRLAEDI